jgi:protein-S-isoprenylcysteine O-methyltransferase Ste14
MWLGAVSAFLPVIGLIYVLHHKFVLPEEARLIATFGDAATTYVAKTRRWV